MFISLELSHGGVTVSPCKHLEKKSLKWMAIYFKLNIFYLSCVFVCNDHKFTLFAFVKVATSNVKKQTKKNLRGSLRMQFMLQNVKKKMYIKHAISLMEFTLSPST